MPNFSFLENKKEYALFAPACMEAEKSMPPFLPCARQPAEKQWNWR